MKLHHPQLKSALPALTRLAVAVATGKGARGAVVLYGTNGCGKTRIANAIKGAFNDRRMDLPEYRRNGTTERDADVVIPNCLFVHWPSAVDGIKKEQWIIFENCQCEYFVILDDIGAEHDPSGIGLEKLYLILNRREHMHTLITTNFSPADWETKFEKRIASRLMRNATHIDLSQVSDYNA